jgi:hypothetical protein
MVDASTMTEGDAIATGDVLEQCDKQVHRAPSSVGAGPLWWCACDSADDVTEDPWTAQAWAPGSSRNAAANQSPQTPVIIRSSVVRRTGNNMDGVGGVPNP